jgi:hypothetical protein
MLVVSGNVKWQGKAFCGGHPPMCANKDGSISMRCAATGKHRPSVRIQTAESKTRISNVATMPLLPHTTKRRPHHERQQPYPGWSPTATPTVTATMRTTTVIQTVSPPSLWSQFQTVHWPHLQPIAQMSYLDHTFHMLLLLSIPPSSTTSHTGTEFN